MLGAQIKKFRQARGMTQGELAEQLHVVRQTVSKWEKGASVPDADLLPRLSAALEVPVEKLLELEDTAAAQVQARLETLEAERNKQRKANEKRGLLILFAFAALLLAPVCQDRAWSIAVVAAFALAGMAVLLRNLELLTGVAPGDKGRGAMVATTAGSIVLVLALAAVIFLEEQGVIIVTELGEQLLAAGIIGVVILFGGIASPRLPFNRHVGLRLPWTVQDADTWYLAHRLLGRISVPVLLFYLAGVLAVDSFEAVSAVALLSWIGIPAAISYRFYWKKYHPKG